jgi:hypothetical protein
MTQENKTWKLITGTIFVILGLGLYGLYFWAAPKWAAQDGINLRYTSVLGVLTALTIFAVNSPSLLLLTFGIPWMWNTKPIVRVWCYRIAAGVLVVGAALMFFSVFFSSYRNDFKSPVRSTLTIAAGVYILSALLFYLRSGKVLERMNGPGGGSETTGPRKPVRSSHPTSVAACNVLHVGADSRQIWQFDAHNPAFNFQRKHVGRPGEPLPDKLIAKSWGSLWQKKLNVAWLPPENVFIRVAQFPQSSPEEMQSMVEFQLEKLSPIPVTQAVWSMHVLPSQPQGPRTVESPAAPLQTVVLVIVARNVVEEFLGRLESEGYLADRLELPLLDQLQASAVREDGAWIYPEGQGGRSMALVAWWYGGVLRNVDLLTLPPTDRAAGLKDQLMQMAWAGELDGWLTAPPHWHLVANDPAAAEWMKLMQEGLDQSVEVIAPLPAQELAARTAQRAVRADPSVNLMPVEFAVRYRQQFVDRLWMRGLVATLGLYAVGLLIYFVAVGFLSYKTRAAETAVAGISLDYTNSLQTKAQYLILKERQELKYAALDCWEAIAETMPENISLESLNFGEGKGAGYGKTLSLIGTAPASDVNTLFDFCDKLRRYAPAGRAPLFNIDNYETPKTSITPGGVTIRWTYDLELKRSEAR